MTSAPKAKPKARDADATQKRILSAAKKEFAKSGLGGARVDVIAERAKANKRMIYHYFNSKEELFQRVLEDAYSDIRTAEQKLELDHMDPKAALETLDPEDVEMLEDMLLTTVNKAIADGQAIQQQEMAKITSGFNMPGLG